MISPCAPAFPPLAFSAPAWNSNRLYRFSSRLPPSINPTPLARLIERARSEPTPFFDLTPTNPTSCFDDYIHFKIQEAFAAVDDYTYEPDPRGSIVAREAIVSYYADRSIRVTPEQIVLTASTSEAYSLLFKIFCDAGDEVLIPTPSYPLFDHLAALENVAASRYKLRYDGSWFLDVADLEAGISENTKAIILVSPNNPTGSILKRNELTRLAQIAAEHHIPLIADEVFSDYVLAAPRDAVRTLIGEEGPLSFSLNGLSKIAGMPQLKLAWIVINGAEDQRKAALARLEIASDAYLSLSTPVQRALPALLRTGTQFQSVIRSRLLENMSQIDTALAGSAAHRLTTEAGWSAIIQVPGILTEEEWVTHLIADQRVLLQPGYFYDLTGGTYLVASLLTRTPDLEAGLTRLRQLLNSVEVSTQA